MIYKMVFKHFIFVWGIVVLTLPSVVWALDKDFGVWHTYTAHRYTQDGVVTCNMYTLPNSHNPNRPKAQLNVTNRPNKPHRIAIHMGTALDTTQSAVLNIKQASYDLEVSGSFVFVQQSDQDAVIYKMKMGAKFTVTATAKTGENLRDTYSLMGFTKALQIIDKNC